MGNSYSPRVYDATNNQFWIFFTSANYVDKQSVLLRGPWSFDRVLILLANYDREIDLSGRSFLSTLSHLSHDQEGLVIWFICLASMLNFSTNVSPITSSTISMKRTCENLVLARGTRKTWITLSLLFLSAPPSLSFKSIRGVTLIVFPRKTSFRWLMLVTTTDI